MKVSHGRSATHCLVDSPKSWARPYISNYDRRALPANREFVRRLAQGYGLPARASLRNRARTRWAATCGVRRMSDPQIRITDHRADRNFASTIRSRDRFRSNLAIQKDGLVAGAMRPANHVRPCQKSPSTNTASRASRKLKSGLPITCKSFRRKRKPSFSNAPASCSSGSVRAVRTARMIRDRVALSNTSTISLL